MKTIIPVVLALSAVLMMAPTVSAQTPAVPSGAAAQKATINLNTATLDQLETLPGIGRKTAERILEQRQKSGGFKKIEDLREAGASMLISMPQPGVAKGAPARPRNGSLATA